jgi:hypothetical protein
MQRMKGHAGFKAYQRGLIDKTDKRKERLDQAEEV